MTDEPGWTYFRESSHGPIYRKAPDQTVERWDGSTWQPVDWRWFSRRIEDGDPTLDDLDEDRALALHTSSTSG